VVQKSTANHHEKPIKQQEPQPKNDPQIPQPDLRFATEQNSEATKKKVWIVLSKTATGRHGLMYFDIVLRCQ